MNIVVGSDAHMERLAIRMMHKLCPWKSYHQDLEPSEHCKECGLTGDDWRRFVIGNVGNPWR